MKPDYSRVRLASASEEDRLAAITRARIKGFPDGVFSTCAACSVEFTDSNPASHAINLSPPRVPITELSAKSGGYICNACLDHLHSPTAPCDDVVSRCLENLGVTGAMVVIPSGVSGAKWNRGRRHD